MRGRKPRPAQPIDAVAEFRALKKDELGSWAFLEDDGYTTRILQVFAGAFVPACILVALIYPIIDGETGGLFLSNIATSLLFGSGVASLIVLVLVLRIAVKVQRADSLLRKSSFVLEYEPSANGGGTSGFYTTKQEKSSEEARRDELIAATTVEPALARARSAVVFTAVASGLSWGLGLLAGGEPEPMHELTPEEEALEKKRRARDDEMTLRQSKIPSRGESPSQNERFSTR